MKKYFFFLAASIMMGGCDHSQHQHGAPTSDVNFYGEQFDPANAISADSVMAMLNGKDSVQVKFSGVIKETCANEGCWMDVKLANGETIFVKMKDHNFFVPTTGAADLQCTVNGWAYRSVTSVEDLKHYAQDAGKTQAEIDAITAPKEGITFVAEGVAIKGYKPTDSHEHHEGDGHDHHDHEHHEGDGHVH